jgi:hypothetical protein
LASQKSVEGPYRLAEGRQNRNPSRAQRRGFTPNHEEPEKFYLFIYFFFPMTPVETPLLPVDSEIKTVMKAAK